MPKKIMQDVVTPNKTTPVENNSLPIKQIAEETIPEHQIEDSLPKLNEEEVKKEQEKEESPIFEKMRQKHEERATFGEEYVSERKSNWNAYKTWAFILLALFVAVGVFVYGKIFYSASVNISLKHMDVPLTNQTFEAVPNDPASIPFQIMSLSLEQSADITATGQKPMNTKASGTITISNAFGPQPQILIKNTRFETADGKIYRIDKTITVPGMTTTNGKNIPGTIDAIVFADVSGSSYNIGLTDFTIPGFKGSPKFQKFSARSKTAIEGGTQGMVNVVSDADMQNARTALTAALKQKLLSEANVQHPKGTVLFPEAVFYTFTEVLENSASSENKNVKFTMKGTLGAVLFDAAALDKKIVTTTTQVADTEQVEISNTKELTFAWQKGNGAVPKDTDTLDFTLSGLAHAVWVVDTETLKEKLVSVPKSSYKDILKLFPGIEKATADIKPFWKTNFPDNPDKIYVTVATE